MKMRAYVAMIASNLKALYHALSPKFPKNLEKFGELQVSLRDEVYF